MSEPRDTIKHARKPTLPSSSVKNLSLKTTAIILQEPEETVQEQKLSNLLEKCFGHVEMALTLHNTFDIKDQSLQTALQKHQSLCEEIEKSIDPDPQLQNKAKKSYKHVMRCCRDSPEDLAKVKQGLDSEMGNAEQLFCESLKRAVVLAREREEDTDTRSTVTPLPTLKSEELDKAIASLTRKITSCDEKINHFRAMLGDLKTPLVSEAKFMNEENTSFSVTEDQKRLKPELDQLTVQRNKLYSENREEERDIQEGTDQVEGEIAHIIGAFDNNMEEMQGDLEARKAELQRIEEELKSLDLVFTPLEGEYDTVVAKQLLAEETTREQQIILQLKTKATIVIQAWWRGLCVRRAMKNKAKKKGKKGKGKRK